MTPQFKEIRKRSGQTRIKGIRSINHSERYSGITRAVKKDFILERYNQLFGDRTFEQIFKLLEEFQGTLDDNLLKEGHDAFRLFLFWREQIAQSVDNEIDPTTYNYYRMAVVSLEKKAEQLMNNFRGYFNKLNNSTSNQDGNKLIYMIASNTENNRRISVAFTDFEKLLDNELKQGLSMYAKSNTLLEQFTNDRFNFSNRITNSYHQEYGIEDSKINNINYFLNKVIYGDDYSAEYGITNKIDDSIITQIRDIIQIGDQYKGRNNQTQTVTSARVVDILLGGNRLEKVANGNWSNTDMTNGGGVLEDLKTYTSKFTTGGKNTKFEYLSKMLGENTPGVFQGDAINFMNGKYDVQIKTQMDGNTGFGLISTNALASCWIMFTNPYLMASIISEKINTGEAGALSKNDQAAMKLWAEDAIAEQLQSEWYNTTDETNVGQQIYECLQRIFGDSLE